MILEKVLELPYDPRVPPRLETERLVLRPMSMADIEFVFRHFSSTETNQFSSYENLKSMQEAMELFKLFIEPGKPSSFRLGIVLRKTGELVGTLGFYGLATRDRRAEIGYDLGKEHWGRGIMTEAVRALVKYGFEEIGLNRIEASVDPENERSVKLLERLCFTREGRLREKYYYKGRFHDDLVYSLLLSDWR